MRVEKKATVVYLTKDELQAFNTVIKLMEDFTTDDDFSDWVEEVTRGECPESIAEALYAIVYNAMAEKDDQNY